MVVLSQNHLKKAKKFEFYKLKTFLDAQKGVKFHHDFMILLILDALLVLYRTVALMITDSQKCA